MAAWCLHDVVDELRSPCLRALGRIGPHALQYHSSTSGVNRKYKAYAVHTA